VEESLLFPWPEPAPGEVDRVHRLLESLRRFFELRVDSVEIDRAGRIPEEVIVGLKELECFGMVVPAADGGMGLSSTGHARVMQEVTALDASVATMLTAHQSLGIKGVLLFGTEEQRRRYLPRAASGELVAAFALSESGAGSDAASIQTRAEPLPDGNYVINGSKTWVTNGSFADIFTVFARTSAAEDGVKPRITAFIVERGPGVRNGHPTDKLGVRGSATTEVTFDNVIVPPTNILGEHGRGFKVAVQVLDSSRLDLASGCVGVCKRVLKMAVDRCRHRRAFGRSIGEFGLIKDKIAMMMSETWALESMTYMTTGMADRGGRDLAVESAICKVFGSETCWRVVNEALEIAAGAGYMGDHPYERILRDARLPLVFGSTNETLRAFIALSGMHGASQEIVEVAKAMREPIKGFGLLSEFAIRKARGLVGRDRLTRPHPAVARESLLLQDYAQQLAGSAERILRKHGRDIAEMQYTQKRTADMAIDLYALAACVARTTWAIERRGEEGARREIDLTAVFASSCERRLSDIVTAMDRNDDELRKAVATKTYVDGGYPFDVI